MRRATRETNTYTDAMTAHSCPDAVLRPPLATEQQRLLLGSAEDVMHVEEFIDGCWSECTYCIDEGVYHVATSPATFMVLRRAYRLQETGQLQWAPGTPEGNAETAKLVGVNVETMRCLALAAGRMWVSRARLFVEIDSIGKCNGQPRVLERPKVNRPGQRTRRR